MIILSRKLLVALAIAGLAAPAQARTQFEIDQTPPPQPNNRLAGMPAVPGSFWSGQHPNLVGRVAPGVVLSGVLENTISSVKSKPGDTFAFTLPDGFVKGGTQVIPPGSRVLGVVTSVTPAKSLRGGHAGSLQVSLQSLVFPDGAHVPFHGFIDANPAHELKNPPAKRFAGSDLRDYGQRVSAMFGSFTSGLGTTMARRYRGNDFVLEKGEMVPIRINRTLTVPDQYITQANIQPVVPTQVPAAQGQTTARGMAAPPALLMNQAQPQAAPPATNAAGLIDQSQDPFNQPVNQPFDAVNGMPDPF